MFRKELLILGGIALFVFLLVAGVTSFTTHAVHRDGYMLAQDTFPGLVTASEAIDRMNENWFNLHMLLSVESPGLRQALIDKITSNSTEPVWRRYREAIFEKQDAHLFEELQMKRSAFLNIRARYFDLVRAGDLAAAQQLFESDLSSAFAGYRQAAQGIFKFNAGVGRMRANRLIQLAHWTPYAAAAFCVTVLLAGVLVGFKATMGAFSGAWSEHV
jgi:Four helix bundle sensory module for signal transduction